MKQHHQTIEVHEEIQGNKPRFGDVSGWARGRSMPPAPSGKPIESAPSIQLRAADRDSLAASQHRRQRIQKRLDAEHDLEIQRGLRESRAMSRAKEARARGDIVLETMGKPVFAPRDTDSVDLDAVVKTTQTVADFFTNFYESRIVRKATPTQ